MGKPEETQLVKRFTPQVGDVFTISIDDHQVGIGQVVAKYGKEGYYFAIFDHIYPRSADLDISSALRKPLAFLTLSLDAKLFNGDWVVVGRHSVADDLPLPAYKEARGVEGEFDVVDYSGQHRRKAEGGEPDVLKYRTTVAPVRLEKALRAKHGIGPWVDAYDRLQPDDLATTAKLFGK
jgi:hypothetical protein